MDSVMHPAYGSTEHVPPDVRLTIESGIGCGDFRDFHKWAEKLLGHPIWTHEFAIEEVWDDLKIALAAWDEGEPYQQGRKAGPVETLMKIAGNKPIIVGTAEAPS